MPGGSHSRNVIPTSQFYQFVRQRLPSLEIVLTGKHIHIIILISVSP